MSALHPLLWLSLALSVSAQGTTTSPPATITPPPSIIPPGPSALPLTEYTFTYPNIPYQVNPFPSARGPQTGYNICNSTTEGPTSLCQTAWFNSIEDFCIWGAPANNSIVGNIEGEVVAYCTKPGRGTRLIPPGTLTAVQFIRTPAYIQITGLMNQVGIGLTPDDAGGELDPHGADLAGNPLGGIVFSDSLPTTQGRIVQVNNWNNFIGGNQFCFKACDNSIRSPNYCENRFDTQGCAFNMPAAYAPGIFLSCLGDNQVPPGGAPVLPATSSCTTYTSSLLYGAVSTSATSARTTGTGTGTRASGTAASSGAATSRAATGGTIGLSRPDTGLLVALSSMLVSVLAGAFIAL